MAFGIDFGTTNTRVAYFDGEKPIMVNVSDARGRSPSIPSVVAYKGGKPIAYGYAAKNARDATRIGNIKWLLNRTDPIEVDRERLRPEEIARDFFLYLKRVVAESGIREPNLNAAAITMPVNYPLRARKQLVAALDEAGIQVTNVYQEPVAALYCHLTLRQSGSTAAVFDWGGGTLDVATVRFGTSRAEVQSMDGLQIGGSDFDNQLARRALEQFLRKYPEIPVSSDELLLLRQAQQLLWATEQSKINLSSSLQTELTLMDFLPGKHVDYQVTQAEFWGLIEDTVDHAVACLRRAIRHSGIAEGLLDAILMSGGTCNIPLVQLRLEQEFGPDRVHKHLPEFAEIHPDPTIRDVSNATAIGAAFLSVFGSRPVFSNDVGVRTADSGLDGFYPVFRAGEAINPSKPRHEEFFVSNTSSGVARLLICERQDPNTNPQGRLLRIVPIPIAPRETSIDVTFEVTDHLTLVVRGTGRIATAPRHESETLISDLNLSYELPENPKAIWTKPQRLETSPGATARRIG